ncbi:hypothetical protein XM38_014310 [Halomicronema hongdechloris C2206]|uniref:Uncharacterized protein n=1 Tax=Halomicronema hongdechloris C2206 TaxID=1641165 RepID=A0A1Z3HJJ8_9CYAN|nr:hypothetical protein [Halomicronema hongdechloris]ASC70492.1 hypothetical protein XM38_014310 [Halomicronema hongdechloris C2206]
MQDNRVSAVLSDADQQDVIHAIATIRQKLSFLIGVQGTERRSLVKLGDYHRAFVRKALDTAQQYRAMLPQTFDLPEMQRDLELFETLQPILFAITQLHELIDSTSALAGSEAYAAALEVCRYTQHSGRNIKSGSKATIEAELFSASHARQDPDCPSSGHWRKLVAIAVRGVGKSRQ